MPYLWNQGIWGLGLWGGEDVPVPLTFDDLMTYYMNLLIRQYINRPNAAGTVGVFVKEVVAGGIYAAVRDGFDLS